VSRFHQAHEFVCWNHSHRLFAPPANNYDLTIVRHTVQDGGETLAQSGISCLCQVNLFLYCTGSLYVCNNYFRIDFGFYVP